MSTTKTTPQLAREHVCETYTTAGDPIMRGVWPIQLYQHSANPKRYAVTYGCQYRTCMDYAEAAAELGQCIMHALRGDSMLDDEDE
jgi:hypothetical protein